MPCQCLTRCYRPVAAGSDTGWLAADARPALLYLHGSPSSRTELGDYEPSLLEERGICAVAVDRPGYGATDPLGDLDLLARIRDAMAVAGHLGMTEFAVQGSSGGGPYALAAAVLMPDQVQAVILTSSGGRISEEWALDAMPQGNADGWRQTWRDPEAARPRLEAASARLGADPMTGLREMTSNWPADQRNWLERTSETMTTDMREATRQGAAGGGPMASPSASRGRSTWPTSGHRSTSSTVTATAWRPFRSSAAVSHRHHASRRSASTPAVTTSPPGRHENAKPRCLPSSHDRGGFRTVQHRKGSGIMERLR